MERIREWFFSQTSYVRLTLCNLLMLGLFVCLSLLRDKQDDFIGIIVPVFLISELIVGYSLWIKGDLILTISTVFLFQTGMGLQILIGKEQHSVVYAIVTLIAGVIGLLGFVMFRKISFSEKKKAQFALMVILVFTIGVTVFLRSFTSPINGTYAWLKIGKHSLQLTEVFKLLLIIFHVILIGSEIPGKWRFSPVYMGIVFVCLVVLHELGSLLVILFVWLALTFVFAKRKLLSLIFATVVCFICTVGWSVCRVAAERFQKTEHPGTVIKALNQIYSRLFVRYSVWSNIDAANRDDAYQAIQARKAIIRGGLFGTAENTVSIPVESSDFAFVGLILRCGVLFGLLILLIYLVILFRGTKIFTSKTNTYDAIITAGSTYTLLFAAIVNIFGTTNFAPLTGVGLPFISSGGTCQVISFTLILVLIWQSGNSTSITKDGLKNEE